MDITELIGAWKLIAAEFRRSDGKITYPWGNPPAGQIIYTAGGRMSAQIMDPSRPKFIARDHMKGTDNEVRTAFEGYQAYYGTYDINEKEKTISHLVEGSVFPNLVGHTLKRYYEIAGSRLTLSTPPMLMSGQSVTVILIWEKLSA